MTQYRIKSISHSGTHGNRGTARTDGRYPKRIGRIVELEYKKLVLGTPLILTYLKDENGNDYSGMYLRCSRIQSIHFVTEKLFVVETMNSIYEFEEVGEENG